MTDDSYTHRPGAVEESESEVQSASNDRATDPEREIADPSATSHAATDPSAPVERGEEEWNWRDWVLVGTIVLCFLVIPAVILVLPPVRPFRFAYLVLPLVPAVLLGAVAVWSAQRST